jgi:dihydropteroate synthase
MQGKPGTMQLSPRYEDLIGEIKTFLADSIERAKARGIDGSKIIIDPGIGFGKSAEDNLKILANLKAFGNLGAPILIGTSRKSFIGKLLGLDAHERLEATLATLAIAVDAGASILRVHDVKSTRRFLDMYLMCLKTALFP